MVVQTLFSVNTDNLRNIFHQKKTLFQIIISYHLVKIRKTFLAPSSVWPVKTQKVPVGKNGRCGLAILQDLGPLYLVQSGSPWWLDSDHIGTQVIWIRPEYDLFLALLVRFLGEFLICPNSVIIMTKAHPFKKVTFVNQSEPVSEPDSWFTSNILDQERLTVTPI